MQSEGLPEGSGDERRGHIPPARTMRRGGRDDARGFCSPFRGYWTELVFVGSSAWSRLGVECLVSVANLPVQVWLVPVASRV